MFIALAQRDAYSVRKLHRRKRGQKMSGLVMVLALVLLTVAPPFALIALAKPRQRRRDDVRDR